MFNYCLDVLAGVRVCSLVWARSYHASREYRHSAGKVEPYDIENTGYSGLLDSFLGIVVGVQARCAVMFINEVIIY